MKVNELRTRLADFNGDLEVILSKDAEGNGFSPAAEVDGPCEYVPETTWSGEVTHPDDQEGESNAVVIWPTN